MTIPTLAGSFATRSPATAPGLAALATSAVCRVRIAIESLSAPLDADDGLAAGGSILCPRCARFMALIVLLVAWRCNSLRQIPRAPAELITKLRTGVLPTCFARQSCLHVRTRTPCGAGDPAGRAQWHPAGTCESRRCYAGLEASSRRGRRCRNPRRLLWSNWPAAYRDCSVARQFRNRYRWCGNTGS